MAEFYSIRGHASDASFSCKCTKIAWARRHVFVANRGSALSVSIKAGKPTLADTYTFLEIAVVVSGTRPKLDARRFPSTEAVLNVLHESVGSSHDILTKTLQKLTLFLAPVLGQQDHPHTTVQTAKNPGSALSRVSRQWPAPRFDPELVGARLSPSVLNCENLESLGEEQWQKTLLPAFEGHSPLQFCGVSSLTSLAQRWNVESLKKTLPTNVPVCVRVAPNEAHGEFVHESSADAYYETEFRQQYLSMPFLEFARMRDASSDARKRHYVQQAVLDCTESAGVQQGIAEWARVADLKKDLETLLSGIVRPLQCRTRVGQVECVTLWVSGSGAVTRCHYDPSANIIVQCEGHKRALLFPPELSSLMTPYPIAHSFDRRTRVDLDALDSTCFPRAGALRSQGVEVILKPGDALWLPYGWWHHIESLDRDNVSLNIFLEDPRITSPSLVKTPVFPGSILAIARQVEIYLSMSLGHTGPPRLSKWCAELAQLEHSKISGTIHGTSSSSIGLALGVDEDVLQWAQHVQRCLVGQLLRLLGPAQTTDVLKIVFNWRRFAWLLHPLHALVKDGQRWEFRDCRYEFGAERMV